MTAENASNARVLTNQFGLLNLLRDHGRLKEIEPVYQRAVAIQEQYLGPNDDSLSLTLQFMASIYREEGESESALPFCQRALQITEHNFGEDDPHVANGLDEYANNLGQLERTDEAAAMRTRAEQIRSRKASPK